MDDRMTTFERRQRIIEMLEQQSVVKVGPLAELFDVSEGTIRNDLTALEEENQLRRVRGGATASDQHDRTFESGRLGRTTVNVQAKRRIGRWAADMIEDGDAIILDASSTVLHMAPCLQQYRRLTVITNGLETARLIAESTTHTVILIGGMVGANANSVTGLLGVDILEDLHVQTAFVSGVGFSLEAGLTEQDLAEAQLKQTMVAKAEQVVALVDSSKFGKVGFSPCLEVSSLTNVVTDSKAPAEDISQLQAANVHVTCCGERTVTTFRPDSNGSTYRIGFANLTETGISFAIDVRRGLERVAEQHHVDLVLADNKLSGEQALRVADYLIEKQVDLVIEYQIDAHTNSLIMNKFSQAGIPVIAVDIPMVGATFFGADNYRAGYIAGVELGRWIQENWSGEFDRVLILEEPRVGTLPTARMVGQLEGIQKVLGEVDPLKRIYLDSGNTSRISETRTDEVLQALPRSFRYAVICFNDDAAYGALTAARNLGREADIAIVGQGCDRVIRNELRKRTSSIIGSTAFMPERYGEKLVGLAKDILDGKPVPPAVYMEHVFIDASNVDDYYSSN
jgi:ribose transport system substrate-binding protein